MSAAQVGAIENLLEALFSARSPIATSAEQLAGGLARKTTLLRDALVLLAATPDAVIGSIGHPGAGMPDPILYFYEHVLAAYDRLERIRRGVYCTPRPLVDYLIRAVDDTLVRDFGKPAGLGDTGVSVLDPIPPGSFAGIRNRGEGHDLTDDPDRGLQAPGDLVRRPASRAAAAWRSS